MRDRLLTLLSQLLVAWTIEADTAVELRTPHRTARGPAAEGSGPWLVSRPMDDNCLRWMHSVPPEQTAPLLAVTNAAGLERWGYLRATPDGLRLTEAGTRAVADAAAVREALAEDRARRYGAELDRLREGLRAIAALATVPLPWALPVWHRGTQAAALAGWAPPAALPADTAEDETPVLLARALLVVAFAVEELAAPPLPITANLLRVLGADPVPAAEAARAAGVSRESAAMVLKRLADARLASIAPAASGRGTVVVLTDRGRAAQAAVAAAVAEVDDRLRDGLGAHAFGAVQDVLVGLLEHPATGAALRPREGAWRSVPPYAAAAAAAVEDPRGALPYFPVVLHRGGYPDGS